MNVDFKKLYDEVEAELKKLEATVAPIVAKMNQLKASIAPAEAEIRELHNKYKELTQPHLVDLQRKKETLAKALGGNVTSKLPEKPSTGKTSSNQ